MAIPKFLEKMRNSIQTSGGTMTGDLILSADPNQNLEAATKQYVDNAGGGFEVTYGETTQAEIINAYQAGKIVYCIKDNKVYYLSQNSDASLIIFINSEYGSITISSNDEWSQDNITPAKLQNTNTFTQMQFMNGASTLNIGQARNITISTNEPTASDGNIGDIWIQYSE